MVEFKRKLYKRGSSFETTIPMPLLFALEKNRKHNVIFAYDEETNKWYIKFEERWNNVMHGEAERVYRQRGWAQIIVSEANKIKIKKSEI